MRERLQEVWVPCSIQPGAFPNERIVIIKIDGEEWSGFVPVDFIEEKEKKTGPTRVRAQVVEQAKDKILLQIPGDALMATLLSISLEEFQKLLKEINL